MKPPRLHLLGLPHTVTAQRYSHCAYTGKVFRFPKMMGLLDYEVIHYGIEGAELGCEIVDILTTEEFESFVGDRSSEEFVGDLAHTDSPLYTQFNSRLRRELACRWKAGDIVCLPFGHAHAAALTDIPDWAQVETGIGYPTLGTARFRIFESNAWYHWHLGRANRTGSDYEWVIPNYFDVSEWQYRDDPKGFVLYFGRIADIKGSEIIKEIALALPHTAFVLCGQGGDPEWDLPNVKYLPPISGLERSDLLGSASVVIMPTRYIEPFGGVAVEAQLCGTPVLGASYGAFTETIEHGMTGYRCRTLGDWIEGINLAFQLDRAYIVQRAISMYGLERLAPEYDKVFMQIGDLWKGGWYSRVPRLEAVHA